MDAFGFISRFLMILFIIQIFHLSAAKATSQDKSSDDDENHIEINLNINLNGVGETKLALGRSRTLSRPQGKSRARVYSEHLKECPKRNGYFSKADGFTCDKRDEHGLSLGLTPDNCQKACDENPDCISFEIQGGVECHLSSSCTYDLAQFDCRGCEPRFRQCLYVKQETGGVKCCREKGVPEMCFGYCLTERKNTQSRAITGFCEEWLKQIGQCSKVKYKFLHHGHCAGSPNPFDPPHTSQKTIDDCANECISRTGVKYFAYKPRSNENSFTCACYVRECKFDGQYMDYKAYEIQGKYKFLHQGHCAGSPNPFDAPQTSQRTIDDCANECISRTGVKYFAYKPRSNEIPFTCRCYARECKFDGQYMDYKAYEIQGPPN